MTEPADIPIPSKPEPATEPPLPAIALPPGPGMALVWLLVCVMAQGMAGAFRAVPLFMHQGQGSHPLANEQ